MADRVSSPPNHQRQLPESAPSASVRDRKGWSGTDPGRGARSGGGSSARRNRTPKAQRRAADLDRKSLTSGSPPQHGRRAPVRRTRLPQHHRLYDAGPRIQRNDFVRTRWRFDEAEGDRDYGQRNLREPVLTRRHAVLPPMSISTASSDVVLRLPRCLPRRPPCRMLRHALPPARIGSAAYIRFLESAPTAALS